MRRIAVAVSILVLLCGSATAASAAVVTIVHSIPGFTADVYVNGKVQLNGFTAGTMAPRVPLPAGTYAIAIRKAGAPASSRAVLSGTLRLARTDDVAVVAHLNTNGVPVLTVFHNRFHALPTGQTCLVVRHVADSAPVDIYVDGRRRLRHLVQMAAGQVALPAGDHTVGIFVAGTKRALYDPVKVSLDVGKVYIVYTVGVAKKHTFNELVDTIPVSSLPPNAVPAGTSGLARITGATSSNADRLLGGLCAILVAGVGAALARGRLRERWSEV